MALIDDIAQVNIALGDLSVNTASFDTLLIIGSSKQAKRVATYSNLNAVSVDYPADTPEFFAAQAAFSQVLQPTKLKIGQRMKVDNVLESYTDAYNAIKSVDNDFYGVVITSRLTDDQEEIAAVCAADVKIFGCSSSDTNILDTTNTANIAYTLKTLGSERNFCMYSSVAATTYAEAAWLALMLAYPAGSANWAHRQIQNVKGELLTDDARGALSAVNCNYIAAFAGRNVAFWGTATSGQYLDVVHGKDWLKSTLQDSIATVLQSTVKVEYTDVGVEQITTAIKAVLENAAANKLIDKETIKITAPRVATVNKTLKNNRILPDVTFEAVLTGAVNKVRLQGTLSI